MYKSIGMPEFYQEAKRHQLPIIDVREIDEYEAGHVPNAKNLPLSTKRLTTALVSCSGN